MASRVRAGLRAGWASISTTQICVSASLKMGEVFGSSVGALFFGGKTL